MSRLEFTNKTKAAAYLRANGHCERCHAPIKHTAFHYDHDLACELGGDNSLNNCVVLCVTCHKAKTKNNDMPLIAKGRRIRKAEMRIKPKSRFPGSRDSKLKKKLSGEVVLR